MSFSTLPFAFLFLPVSLALYLVIPRRFTAARNVILVLCSLVFFAWGSAEYLILLLLSIGFNFFTAKLLTRCRREEDDRGAKRVVVSGVVVNLLLLGFFKYYGFLIENFNAVFGAGISQKQLPAPIGVSFFTFSILSYLFDVYRGKVETEGGILDFSLYVTFFPKLVSGPIVAYHDMADQIRDHPVTLEGFGSGVRKFLVGLAKKVLVADTLGTTFYALSALPADRLSVTSAWLGAVTYSLMLCFDFSGYSDMAIGLAEMFGFRFGKNFDYPYASTGVSEFWRRWHISLGAWFRDYVYIPLGGSRVGTFKTIRNLMVVWLLTGLWHGANWTFIFWGIYYGILLTLEKFVFRSVLEKIPTVIRRILTLLLVVIGWVFFFSPSLGSAFTWIGHMLGGGAGFLDATAKYYLGSTWLILLAAILGSSPLPAVIGNNLLCRKSVGTRVITVLFFAALLFFCIAGMVSDTYSSFLYFQF